MTPQLQQAIKMLQLSNLELADYVDAEIEQNPLLERSEGDGEDNAPINGHEAEVNGVAVAAEPTLLAEPPTGNFSAEAVETWDSSRGGDGDGSADYGAGDFGGDNQPWRTRNGGD